MPLFVRAIQTTNPPRDGQVRAVLRQQARQRIHTIVEALVEAGSPGLAHETAEEVPKGRRGTKTRSVRVPLREPVWLVGSYYVSSGKVHSDPDARTAPSEPSPVARLAGINEQGEFAYGFAKHAHFSDRQLAKVVAQLESIAQTYGVDLPS